MTAVFGAPEWRASSGRKVELHEDGTVTFEGVHGYLAPGAALDAEELFQARRDADLGRWRWPENPHYIVYQDAPGATVVVIDERSGWRQIYENRRGAERLRNSYPAQAAVAYFEAHPERKPWQLAEAGQVWVLTVPDPGDVDAEIVTVATTYGTFTAGSTREWVLRDPAIRTARRVPTEVAS